MENERKKLGQKLTRKVMEMQKLNVEIGNLEELSIKERARILIKFRISSYANSFGNFMEEIAKMNSIVVILLLISTIISIAGWTCLISMLIKRFLY